MANKETLQTYNTNLSGNNDTLKTILETINNLPEAGEGGGSASILPEGYTELLYIKSSGTQYIDTDLKVTEKTNFTVTFRTYDGFTTSSFGSIFATRQTYNANGYHLTTYPGDTQPANTGHFLFGGTRYSAGLLKNDNKQTASYKDGVFYSPDGTTIDLSSVKTAPPGTMRIFALKDTSAGETGVYDLGKVALYKLVFEENGVPVANYIPARRDTDGTVGLYDIVSGNFYTNKGTGLFDYEDKFTTQEDIVEELTAQDTGLTTQETTIEDIIAALEGKGIPAPEGEPDYITDGLVAWWEGCDDVDENGHWNSRVGDDYITNSPSYSSGSLEGSPLNAFYNLKSENAYRNNMIYGMETHGDYYVQGYTIEFVGKSNGGANNAAVNSNVAAPLLAFNKANGPMISNFGADGFFACLNYWQDSGLEKKFTNCYNKRYKYALHLAEIIPRNETSGNFHLYYSLNDSKWYERTKVELGGCTEKHSNTTILAFYWDQYKSNGEVNSIRVYNRKLTEEELKHNYEIDKKRFNLDEYSEGE